MRIIELPEPLDTQTLVDLDSLYDEHVNKDQTPRTTMVTKVSVLKAMEAAYRRGHARAEHAMKGMPGDDHAFRKMESLVNELLALLQEGMRPLGKPVSSDKEQVAAIAGRAYDRGQADARAGLTTCKEPVVWADETSPFTCAQVRALLEENEKLRMLGGTKA